MLNNDIIAQRSPKFKLERNKKIANYYFDTSYRLSIPALARKFQISEARTAQIIRDWRKNYGEEVKNHEEQH